jgi:hypothetical protein
VLKACWRSCETVIANFLLMTAHTPAYNSHSWVPLPFCLQPGFRAMG